MGAWEGMALEGGRLVLTMPTALPYGLGSWDELSLRPPARAAASHPPVAARFRDCRNHLEQGRLRLSLDALERLAAARLAPLGLSEVRLAMGEAATAPTVTLSVASTGGSARADLRLTFRLMPDPERPWQVRVGLDGIESEGPAPLPNRELGQAILRALLGGAVVDVAREATFPLFVSRGWRAPGVEGTRFTAIEPQPTREVVMRFARTDGAPREAFPGARDEASPAAARPTPGWRRLLLDAADAADALGDVEAATGALERAAQPRENDGPSEAEERAAALSHLAHLLERRGRFDAAARAAREATTLAPGHAPALVLYGDLAQRLGESAEAYAAYESLARAPGVLHVLAPEALASRRGEAAWSLGRAKEAVDHWEAAARYNPRDPAPHRFLADAASRRGDWPEAARHLEDILRLLPLEELEQLTDVRHRLGETLANLGDWGGARYHLELVISQDPQRTSAWETLTDVTDRLGLYEQTATALERLSRIYATAEQRAEALYRRGELLREKLEDRPGALDSYLKASDVFPPHAGTAARLVEVFWELGDYESLAGLSSDLFEQGQIREAPNGTRLRLVMGICLARQGASPTSDETLSALPWEPQDVTAALLEVADNLGDAPLSRLEPLLASLVRWQGPLVEHSLHEGLLAAWSAEPSRLGALRALAFLAERSADDTAARALLSALAFASSQEPAWLAARLDGLGMAPSPRRGCLTLGGPVDHPACQGDALPLRRALARLAGPLQGRGPGAPGLAASEHEGLPGERAALARGLAELLEAPEVRFVTVADTTPSTVAIATHPTRPATISVPAAALLLHDEELTFLLARALDLARSGLASVRDLGADDVATLLRAPPEGRAPPVPADALPALATWPSFLRGTELARHRFALLACRSPAAALNTLARLDPATPTDLAGISEENRRELLSTTPFKDLLSFMLSPAYAASLEHA